MARALIAIDWGTTNRRAFVLDREGRVLDTRRDDRGLLAMQAGDFAGEVESLRSTLGDLPVLLAGMVGSARGWVEVPYLACPAGIADLASALHWIEPGRTAIVPGLADPRGDVMRGEEVQLLGAVAAGLSPADALLCQPGTHCKWARMADGKVAGFSTAMTGELFALLKGHSLLADFLKGAVRDGDAFRSGVQTGLSGRLSTHLFRTRANVLLGKLRSVDAAAFTSGLLIGHDVGGENLEPGEPVYILADRLLGPLYAKAVELVGGRPVAADSHAAFVAGITQIWKMSQT